MQSIAGTICDVSRTSSCGTEARSSASEQSSSEADGFSVYSGEDVNVTFLEPFGNDAVEFHKSLSGPSANVRQERYFSRGRRSSSGSVTSLTLEDDVEAGYEADSDTHAASRRPSAHRIRAKSRQSRRVQYLVERVEPIIEVLAPMTPEELAYLKAHTNIPIPAHYEHLLPKDAGEASGSPSTASPPSSEILSNRAGCGGVLGCTQPTGALQSQHLLLTECEQQLQSDFGSGFDDAGEYPSPRVLPVNLADKLADNAEPGSAEDSSTAATPSVLEVTPRLASPVHPANIHLDNHFHPLCLQDLPPTPNLHPWLAVTYGEPSPMVLASPTVPLLLHSPRPRLVHMPRLR